MSPHQLEQEARTGRIAGIAGVAGGLLILINTFAGFASDFYAIESDQFTERLTVFADVRGEFLTSTALQVAGLLLLAAPLFVLFRAVADRNPGVRRSLIGLTIVGPLFFAAAAVLLYVSLDAATETFMEGMDGVEDVDQFAEDTLVEQSTFGIYGGLQLAGALGLVVSLVYTSLQAMRAGLLTRFLGTLGMALGVGFLLLGPIALAVWGLFVAPLLAGWWRGPRPPAWETGEVIPWPKPGEQPGASFEDEPARPEDFEGTGHEVEPEEEPDSLADEPARPGRRENRRKRKRKQR